MIELKNINKTYKSKKGSSTKAIDNISLSFHDQGMTFILGKSGCGKSTLLNLIGGLDKYDTGDMLVLNKSSQDFKQADFDCYRNTYIGFIFQDFNLLDDYNVYENIALALQLKQEPVTESKINDLLEKLELIDLKNRKVNELSGGQKQRVAIARALIKNPKIILADEPTGNLDSNTGKQVMNLLQKISKERLVVIVSHDNELANFYANRILEIKDGKVIRDTNPPVINNLSDKYEIIKSKLPLKESFKLGIGSLKHKKIKLFFTILLTTCTLLALSLTDTLSSYNVAKAYARLLSEQNESSLIINKFALNNDNDYLNKIQIELDNKSKQAILAKINKPYYPVYKIQESNHYLKIGELLKIEDPIRNMLYTPNSGYFAANIIATDDLSINEKIIGKIPKNSKEILISNYVDDLIISGGINTYESNTSNEFSNDKIFNPKNYEYLLNSNKTFYFGSLGKVKISGIIDYDLSKYHKIKNVKYDLDKNSKEELALYQDLLQHLDKFGNIYVTSNFIKDLSVIKNEKLDTKATIYDINSDSFTINDYQDTIAPAIIDNELEYFNGTCWLKTKDLKKDEIVLNIRQLNIEDMDDYQFKLSQYLNKYSNNDKTILEKRFFENYLKDYNVIGKFSNFKIKNLQLKTIGTHKLKVVGIAGLQNTNSTTKYYLSKEIVGKYRTKTLQQTGYMLPDLNENALKNLLESFPYDQEISATSIYSFEVTSLVSTINLLKTFALYASIVLLIFTIFLIGNFVITSINYRKKEIGILRALGARSNDIIKIFMWEGLTLALISATLASIILVGVTNLLNTFLMAGASLIITPFIIGIRQFIVIYLVVFVVAIIASIIPSIKISKMKPIDAILNK